MQLQRLSPPDLLPASAARPDRYDELCQRIGSVVVVRPHWREFHRALEAMPAGELAARRAGLRRPIHEDGLTYKLDADPRGVAGAGGVPAPQWATAPAPPASGWSWVWRCTRRSTRPPSRLRLPWRPVPGGSSHPPSPTGHNGAAWRPVDIRRSMSRGGGGVRWSSARTGARRRPGNRPVGPWQERPCQAPSLKGVWTLHGRLDANSAISGISPLDLLRVLTISLLHRLAV